MNEGRGSEETASSEEVRPPAWGRMHLVVALLIFLSFGTFRRREIWELFADGGIDFEIKLKILLWIAVGGMALCCWRRIYENSHLLLRAPLLLYFAFSVLAALSALYSGTPSLTLFRAGQLGTVIALCIAVADRIERWPILVMLFLGMNWVLLLIGFTGYPESLNWRLLPGYQEASYVMFEDQMWRFGTPMGHFSQIGIAAAMALLALIARLRRIPTLGEGCVLFWLLLTVLLSVSRTAIGGLVAGLLFILFVRGLFAISMVATAAIVSILLVFPGVGPTFTELMERGQSQEELMTLNNRTNIYESAFKLLGQEWILGHGYRSRAIVLDQQDNDTGVSHAHNAVLEAALGMGIGGALTAVLLLIALPVCALNLLLKRRPPWPAARRDRYVEFMALCFPILSFSMLDSSFALEASPFIVFFVAILVDLSRCRTPLLGSARALSLPKVARANRPGVASSVGDVQHCHQDSHNDLSRPAAADGSHAGAQRNALSARRRGQPPGPDLSRFHRFGHR